MWPLVRVGGFVAAAPVFSNRAVPIRVRVLLGVALTLAVLPAVGRVPAIDPLSVAGIIVTAQQVIIGVSLGFIVNLSFEAVVVAGESVSLTMGLGFATMVDPASGQSTPVISQFLVLLVVLLFLSVGGHLMLIHLLAESFRTLPVGAAGLHRDVFYRLAGWATTMFAGGVLLALPALAVLLIATLILGVMTRAAPQLNIFSVGFPITILIGFVVLNLLVVPALSTRMAQLWSSAFDTIQHLILGTVSGG